MNYKTEIWLNHEIRFIQHKGEWWGVAVDVVNALELGNTTMALRRLDDDLKALITVEGNSDANLSLNIISELGIYKLVLTSRKPEARAFERWIFEIIKQLRESTGLEAFQVFRMLDKEHQKEAMERLKTGLYKPVRKRFYKS